MNKIEFIPEGVCSKHIEILLNNDSIESVIFVGGCSGNLQGIAQLAKGMKIQEVIDKLHSIKCGNKSTSCPAQLAIALQNYLNKN